MTAPLLLNLSSQTTKSASALVRDAIGLGEKYGSSVRRVTESFVAYGLYEPLFDTTQGGMAVTVFKQTAQQAGTAPKKVEIWLKQLRAQDRIEFGGATKTGSYYSKRRQKYIKKAYSSFQFYISSY